MIFQKIEAKATKITDNKPANNLEAPVILTMQYERPP